MASKTSGTRIVAPADADQTGLSQLFAEAFGEERARFLLEHGDWWHRGADGRSVAVCEGEVAGYRATTPCLVHVDGREVPAVWGMDLYVSPRFRGRGLQRLLDARLRQTSSLRMSFPNDTGARIYSKQGYTVREDLHLHFLPLRPRGVPVRAAGGAAGAVRKGLRIALAGLSPLAALFRLFARRYRPHGTRSAPGPAGDDDLGIVETIYRRSVPHTLVTTVRDRDFLQWRYLDAPYRSELVLYLGGPQDRPTHFAIVRYGPWRGSPAAKILDLFGDFEDSRGMSDLLRTIVRDATRRETCLVSGLACSKQMQRAFGRAGLLFRRRWRFRWLSDDPEMQSRLAGASLYWTLADCDNEFT